MSSNLNPNPGLSRLQTARVTAAMRRQIIGRVLYSAADVPFSFSHDGVPYTIPPDGPSKERFSEREGISRPHVVKDDGGEYAIYDGTLEVFDRYGVTAQAAVAYRKALRSNRGRRTPTKPEANKLLAGAEGIVAHAVRKLGKSGVTFLLGGEDDKAAKAEARATYLKFKVAQVDRILKNYGDRTAAFHGDIRNRGSYAPPMDEHELAAQQWKDEYMLGMKATSRLVCVLNCGFAADDEAVIDRHMRAAHPMSADAQVEPAPAPKPPPVQAAPPPRLAPSSVK